MGSSEKKQENGKKEMGKKVYMRRKRYREKGKQRSGMEGRERRCTSEKKKQ